MMKNIRLVEKRVAAAVERLSELKAERDSHREQVAALEKQLKALKVEAAADAGDRAPEWNQRRAEAVELIRNTLAEIGHD